MCAGLCSLSSFQLVLSLALGKPGVLIIFCSVPGGTLQTSDVLSV